MEVVTILRHPTLALRLNSIIEEDVQGYLAVAERSFVWIVYAVASCTKETEITTFLRGLSKFSVWNSCKIKSSGDASACVPVPEGEESESSRLVFYFVPLSLSFCLPVPTCSILLSRSVHNAYLFSSSLDEPSR